MFGFSQSSPFDFQCDAPAYKIVQACRRVGLRNPEDVRWCRLREFLRQSPGWKGLLHPHTWRRLFSAAPTSERGCSCGSRLPALDRVTFTFTTGNEVTYHLGQCSRCRTIFWDEV